MSDSAERYRTRFSGYDLTTLHVMTACGDAVYDTDEHRWRIAAGAVPAGLPAVVPDVDWQAAHAAIQASAPAPQARPLVFARAVTPAVTVGLDETLTLILQVPEGATRLTISNGDALNGAVAEARQVRAQIEATQDAAAGRPAPGIEAGT